jgi:hypothetical protein
VTDSFDPPGSASKIVWKDYLGSLLLIEVQKIEEKVPTRYGDTDAVRAAIHVLAGPNEGDGLMDALVFPRVLQSQLRGKVGGRVLGRLGQGAAKTGQDAPWKLDDPTEADKQTARAWIAKNDKPPF